MEGRVLYKAKAKELQWNPLCLGAGLNHTISQETRKQPESVSRWLELAPGNRAECGVSDEGDDEGDGRFSATFGFSLRTVDLLCCPSAVNSHFSAHQ